MGCSLGTLAHFPKVQFWYMCLSLSQPLIQIFIGISKHGGANRGVATDAGPK